MAVIRTRSVRERRDFLVATQSPPNPQLRTFSGGHRPLGWGSTLLYRRTRNLYFLGFAHATVGLLLFLVVPDSISRHLRVGPGWFRP